MKVVLINPPTKGRQYVREGRCEQRISSFQYKMVPISLPSIAALLETEGFEVKILDCLSQNLTSEEIVGKVLDWQPTLVVMNMATATYDSDREVIHAIRTISRAHITAIGIHVTALSESTLRESELDSVIRGEPEEICLHLAKVLRDAGSIREIQAISYKEQTAIIHNSRATFINDLDALPFPARHLINNRSYTLPIRNRPYTLLISSRGCPYNCIFCTAKQYYGTKVRLRSPGNIVDEMAEIIGRWQITDIVMWSDTFTLVRDHVMGICNEIIKRKLSCNWMCNSRVDKVDEALLSKMKQAGCSGISYGVESGVQEILDRAKKEITTGQIERAFMWTHQAKIQTLAHIIFGLPGESKSTIQTTLEFVKKLNPDFVQFYCAIPFPGTELYSICKANGWLVTSDWSKFELNHAIIQTPSLSVSDLRKARMHSFMSFYLRPSYVIRKFPLLLSQNDLKRFLYQIQDFFKDWVR
jgi:radical SAM superfamily enzyme YgiQ (UPF0313 family)